MRETGALLTRFLRVLEVIDLDSEITVSVAELADIAAYSRFHFQRQFKALFGLSIADYQRRIKLKRAAHKLVFRTGQDVLSVAMDAGFETPEGFSKAFRRAFGQSPTGFRKSPDWAVWQTFEDELKIPGRARMNETTVPKIQVSEFPETKVAILDHKGPPHLVGLSLARFISWRKEQGLPPSRSATFNLLYDDPSQCAPEEYRFGIACATSKEIETNDVGVRHDILPGGPCATFRHRGSLDTAEPALRHFFGVWLPESGREIRDFPIIVRRHNFYPDVPEAEVELEFILLLQ